MKKKAFAKRLLITCFKFFLIRGLLASSFSELLFAQARSQTITGIVLDDGNQPLSGVTIAVKGKTDIGTTTDAKGAYAIKAAPGDIPAFSFIGHEGFESRVGSQSTLNATLE
jgi:hypothetical protein